MDETWFSMFVPSLKYVISFVSLLFYIYLPGWILWNVASQKKNSVIRYEFQQDMYHFESWSGCLHFSGEMYAFRKGEAAVCIQGAEWKVGGIAEKHSKWGRNPLPYVPLCPNRRDGVLILKNPDGSQRWPIVCFFVQKNRSIAPGIKSKGFHDIVRHSR